MFTLTLSVKSVPKKLVDAHFGAPTLFYHYFFNHLSNQLKNLRCQSTPFCGFNTHGFRLDKSTIQLEYHA